MDVLANVLRRVIQLEARLEICCGSHSAAVATPAPETYLMEFSGYNNDNALRHLFAGTGGGNTTANGEINVCVPFAGVVQSLQVQLVSGIVGTFLGPTSVLNFIVRKNAISLNDIAYNTALKVTQDNAVPPGIGGWISGQDNAHPLYVVATDVLGVSCQVVNGGGTLIPLAYARLTIVKT